MRFLGKRLLLFVGALVGLSLLVFALLRILPGDVAAVVAGTMRSTIVEGKAT